MPIDKYSIFLFIFFETLSNKFFTNEKYLLELFEFFDNYSIRKLLNVWKNLLTKDGFITTTATSSRWKLQEYFDKLKIWVGKVWLGVIVYPHTRNQMRENFKKAGLKFVEGPAIIPYFKRYSMTVK